MSRHLQPTWTRNSSSHDSLPTFSLLRLGPLFWSHRIECGAFHNAPVSSFLYFPHPCEIPRTCSFMIAMRTAMKTNNAQQIIMHREHAGRNPVEMFYGFLGIATDAGVRYWHTTLETTCYFLSLYYLRYVLNNLFFVFIAKAYFWWKFSLLFSKFSTSIFKPDLKKNTKRSASKVSFAHASYPK